MTVDIEKLSTEEIIQLYPKILKELKKRGVIRTKNFIGDIGEFLAIEGYNKNPNVPNLERADAGTEGYDAISQDGTRYQIQDENLINELLSWMNSNNADYTNTFCSLTEKNI